MIFVIITDSENGDDDDYNDDKEGRKSVKQRLWTTEEHCICIVVR